DILEEIVGDIRDEDDQDEVQPIIALKDGRFLVDPIVSLGDLESELDLHLEVPEDTHVETLGGLVHATLGYLPAPGAEVDLGPCKVRVLKVEGTRMEQVVLERKAPVAE
ncbi:MAG TPA: transporter associated domain-containing protein, partial [Fibrobacteraceae bacterium]|nr:transporter associated domain-containing protein [Fibrobacteraceae bacterium]